MLSVRPSLHLSVHQSIHPSWNTPPPQQMIFPVSSEHWYLQEHCVRNHISCCAGWYPINKRVHWTGAYTKDWLAKSLKAVYSWRQTCKGVVTVTNGLNSRVLQMCVLQREAGMGGGDLHSSPSKQQSLHLILTLTPGIKADMTGWTEELQLQLQLPSSA